MAAAHTDLTQTSRAKAGQIHITQGVIGSNLLWS